MSDDAYEVLGIEGYQEHHFRRLLVDWLGRIEQKQDEGFEQVNGRISRLEQFRFMAMGALAVVSALVVPLFIFVVVGS